MISRTDVEARAGVSRKNRWINAAIALAFTTTTIACSNSAMAAPTKYSAKQLTVSMTASVAYIGKSVKAI